MSNVTEIKAGLSRQEAARYLGVSEKTVQRRVMLGELAAVRIGRRVLFLRSELDQFLEASMVKLAA
jgi:excisionase family DNA binding protein